MPDTPESPDDPLTFIKDCVRGGRIYWTYHVNMRLIVRAISRSVIRDSVDTYEVIESYPDDNYLPSYLVLARHSGHAFHILFATDVAHDNVRIVTAYRPDPREWDSDFKQRKTP